MDNPWIQKPIGFRNAIDLDPDDMVNSINAIISLYCEEVCLMEKRERGDSCYTNCDSCGAIKGEPCYHCMGNRTDKTEKYYQMIQDTFGTIPTRQDYNNKKLRMKRIEELNRVFEG